MTDTVAAALRIAADRLFATSDTARLDAELLMAHALGVTRWGTVRVDHRTQMTNLDGVFAVGDIVRGASLVVWAIKDGRDVVEHMHKWMLANLAKTKVAA